MNKIKIEKTLLCIVYPGEKADSSTGSHTPMRGGHNYFLLDKIHPPPGKDMIDNLRVESHDQNGTRLLNPTSFPMMRPGFQKFDHKLEKQVIRQ
jgi:hypothetical protein